MLIRLKTGQYEFAELDYKNIEEFENNYVTDYLIIKAKHKEAEKAVAEIKLKEISEELLEEMNEKKFGDLTEAGKVANCFDMAAEAKRLRKINVLEKTKYKYLNKLTVK